MPSPLNISRLQGAPSPAQGVNAIPVLTLTTNTETLITNQAGNPAVISPQPAGQIVGATTAPSYGSGFDGYPIRVRATFKAQNTVASSTAIVALYANQVGTTITSGNKVGTITSQSLGATGSAAGYIEANLIWDGMGQILTGTYHAAFGSASQIEVALTNTTIAIAALANLNFSLTAQCGTTSKSVNFIITEFVVDTW
jgi:hypothetical protein